MTRGEIRAAAISMLRESSTPVRWLLTEVNRYLDDGYRDLAERTAAVVRTFTVNVPADTNYVVLPSITDGAGTFDVLHPLAVKDVSSDLPLDAVHWGFFDGQDRVWARTPASRPYFYAFWDWLTLLIYPHYGSAGQLSIIASVIPRGFTGDSQEPEIPVQYHDALIHYVVWRCLLKGAKGPRFGRANRQLRHYSERMLGLGEWTQERHEGIFTAIYGKQLRVPQELWGT